MLSAVVPVAQKLLMRSGEFYPFGAYLAEDGNIMLVHGRSDLEFPDPKVIRQQLFEGLAIKAGRGEIRAGAVCDNATVSLPDESGFADAIRVSIEHRDDIPGDIYLP